ncbi:MAG: SMP-30/gluconolactonase/LRE family protein [Lewinellaceae bacterium]|nr:SMP-30/gluconolactonase/LRE family protein [Lewinellaceae bacterium]
MPEQLNRPLKVIDTEPALLGEGPVWDAHRQCICWVDILNGHIHEFTPTRNTYRQIQVNDMVGAVALRTNGHFIAALKSGLAFVNRDTGAVQMLHHPEVHLPGNRFNDGKCDPAGRFWVGTMALSEEPGAGSLYMIEKDLSHSRKIAGVSISNGLAWSPDHKTFYYIDTPTMEVVAYDYDIRTGEIAGKRTVITIPENQGFPDGMTIDRDGMLWIAHWDGWQVTRWDPLTGEQLLQIPLPVARVTSCTFGGADFRDLYITTARVGLTEEQLAQQPLAGRLFVVADCGYEGVEAWAFGE